MLRLQYRYPGARIGTFGVTTSKCGGWRGVHGRPENQLRRTECATVGATHIPHYPARTNCVQTHSRSLSSNNEGLALSISGKLLERHYRMTCSCARFSDAPALRVGVGNTFVRNARNLDPTFSPRPCLSPSYLRPCCQTTSGFERVGIPHVINIRRRDPCSVRTPLVTASPTNGAAVSSIETCQPN